jgi:hypothetical protein
MKQVEALACSRGKVESETRYCQADWIRDNARYIADIETRRTERTLYGEWSKGWKAEMLRASKENAKSLLIERFLRDECKQLDGAIWLGNIQIIEQMERQI